VWRYRLERIFVTHAFCCAAVAHMKVTIEDQRMPWNSVCDIMRHTNHGFAGCSNIKTELSHSGFKHWQKCLFKEAPGRDVPCRGDVLVD
jgi:predicted alpha/beta hydrolase family esterase